MLETLYTVSQKNIPDIFDCNLKINYQILIIFGTNIPDTTCHQLTVQFSTSSSICFCTTWGKHNQQNITFYPMRYDCLINITREKHISFTFLTLGLTFYPVVHFSTACSKNAWSICPLCEHRLSPFVDSSIDKVLRHTNAGCTSHFLTSQRFLKFIWQKQCCMTVKTCNRPDVEAHKLGQVKFIDVFPFILTLIMPGLFSPGSAKADVGWGEN